MKEPAPSTDRTGERVFQEPQVRNNRLIFTSVIPNANDDPCVADSATGWVNVLDARDGSRLSVPPLDINQDGLFTDADLVDYNNQDHVLSSVRFGDQDVVYSAPAGIVSGADIINYVADSSGGQPVKLLESTGLVGRAWLEIR